MGVATLEVGGPELQLGLLNCFYLLAVFLSIFALLFSYVILAAPIHALEPSLWAEFRGGEIYGWSAIVSKL